MLIVTVIGIGISQFTVGIRNFTVGTINYMSQKSIIAIIISGYRPSH